MGGFDNKVAQGQKGKRVKGLVANGGKRTKLRVWSARAKVTAQVTRGQTCTGNACMNLCNTRFSRHRISGYKAHW